MIILAIAVPGITGIIKSSTGNAFAEDAKMVIQQLKYKKIEDDNFNLTSIDEKNITNLNLSNANYDKLSAGMVDNNLYIVIIGKNKWSGLKACGTRQTMSVVDASDTTTCRNIETSSYDESKGVNKPQLTTGMTPIKWNGTTWVDTAASDTNWYNYDTTNKQWANARTADGSMFVWIPRYIYKISNGWHKNTAGTIDIQFSKDTDDNWNNAAIGNINTDTTSNSSNNTWTNEPSFDFGSTKLTGIWVAKFEATAVQGVVNGYTSDGSCPITGDDVTAKTIKVVPNVSSWRCISIGNMFTAIRNMETNTIYGWGTSGKGIDTHLIKNTEWGTIAYLSKSNLGQGTNEVWINNSQKYTTGCAGTAVSSGAYNGCQSTYNSSNGMHASTTGNIYGIYDISGGAWEYVSAYINNTDANLGQGSSIVGTSSQYKNIYTVGGSDNQTANYVLAINQKGDAVYETSSAGTNSTSWFGDFSYIIYANRPWLKRGGDFSNTSNGGVFSFNVSWGGLASNLGFRPVIVVNSDL